MDIVQLNRGDSNEHTWREVYILCAKIYPRKVGVSESHSGLAEHSSPLGRATPRLWRTSGFPEYTPPPHPSVIVSKQRESKAPSRFGFSSALWASEENNEPSTPAKHTADAKNQT